MPLSPFTKRGAVAGARLVRLVASLRFVMSINRSRAIYSGVLSTAPHFPIGHFSVAILSFAHVLHPHLRQRPVLFSAAASHSGQARHVASRVARTSGGVVAKPARAKRVNAALDFDSISAVGIMKMKESERMGERRKNPKTCRIGLELSFRWHFQILRQWRILQLLKVMGVDTSRHKLHHQDTRKERLPYRLFPKI